MKKPFKRLISLVLVLLLYSCGTLSEAGKVLRNEKINNTDEFLVKKREPLVLPPEYKTLPEPGTVENLKKDQNKIGQILKIPTEQTSSDKSSSVEQSILNKIGK